MSGIKDVLLDSLKYSCHERNLWVYIRPPDYDNWTYLLQVYDSVPTFGIGGGSFTFFLEHIWKPALATLENIWSSHLGSYMAELWGLTVSRHFGAVMLLRSWSLQLEVHILGWF